MIFSKENWFSRQPGPLTTFLSPGWHVSKYSNYNPSKLTQFCRYYLKDSTSYLYQKYTQKCVNSLDKVTILQTWSTMKKKNLVRNFSSFLKLGRGAFLGPALRGCIVRHCAGIAFLPSTVREADVSRHNGGAFERAPPRTLDTIMLRWAQIIKASRFSLII